MQKIEVEMILAGLNLISSTTSKSGGLLLRNLDYENLDWFNCHRVKTIFY
jgi:hypothetical protein